MPRKEEIKAKIPEIQLVIFRLRDEEFGVNISEVREIVRMMEITHIPEAPGFIEGVINLRGQVIAVVELAMIDVNYFFSLATIKIPVPA